MAKGGKRKDTKTGRDCRVFLTRSGKEIRLIKRDCAEDMRDRLVGRTVDVVVTSPPYNLGIKYKEYDDTITRTEYLYRMGVWAASVMEVLSPDGSVFLNVGSKPSDPMVPFELLRVMTGKDLFHLQNVIHWVKSIAVMKEEVGSNYPGIAQNVVVGHYKPINSKRFLNDCHEYIFHLTKHGDTVLDRLAVGVPYQDQSNVRRWSSATGGVHCRGNTWFIPYKTIQSRDKERPHPATFPTELPLRCIKLHGVDRTHLVMDPFLGIGTSAVACAALDIPFVGYEIAQDYFDEACDRVRLSPYGMTEKEAD